MADLSIDLGTARTIVLDTVKGTFLSAPSAVAYEGDSTKILCVGDAAREMEGRVSERIRVVSPVQAGTIHDFGGARALVKRMIDRVAGSRRLFARIVAVVPGCATDIERRAIEELLRGTGGRSVHLVPKALASAWGASLEVGGDRARMIIDIGAGTTEIAVIAFGDMIASESLKIGGDAFDTAIISQVRARHHLRIGRQTAERLKIALGSATSETEPNDSDASEERIFAVCGNDLASARPARVEIHADLVADAMRESIGLLLAAVDGVIKRLPPDVCIDLSETGITLAGGGAAVPGLAELIAERTGMPATRAEHGELCVVRGASMLPSAFKQSRRLPV